MPRPAPEEVLDLLAAQAALYEKLESLALQQRSLVTRDEVGPLLSVLGRRRGVAEALSRIGARLAPVRRQWAACRGAMDPSQQVEADRLLSDAGDRLRRVIEGDLHDARILSARKQAVGEALQVTQSTRQAITSYQVPVDQPARLDCTDGGGA